MTSEKGVIRIIKQATSFNEYDEYYYVADITTDIDGHLMARNTGNIWDAMKFIWNSPNEDERNRIESLIKFVETCYLPRKKYVVEFIPITIEY